MHISYRAFCVSTTLCVVFILFYSYYFTIVTFPLCFYHTDSKNVRRYVTEGCFVNLDNRCLYVFDSIFRINITHLSTVMESNNIWKILFSILYMSCITLSFKRGINITDTNNSIDLGSACNCNVNFSFYFR